jgi:hypothetical protein
VSPRTSTWTALAFLIPLACDGSLLTIDVKENAKTTVAKGTLVEVLVSDLGFGDFVSMDLTASEELRNQGVAPGDVEDVRLTLFELEATEPDGADLSFLTSMEVWVEAEGLEARMIASANAFPEGESLVSFTLEDVDLTDYVASQAMTITTEVEGRRPEVDTTVVARLEVAVGVTRQGACNNL